MKTFIRYLKTGFKESAVMRLSIIATTSALMGMITALIFGKTAIYYLLFIVFDVCFIAGTILQMEHYEDAPEKYKPFFTHKWFNYVLILFFFVATISHSVSLAEYITSWFIENHTLSEDSLLSLL